MESLSKHSAVTQRNLRCLVACLLTGFVTSGVLACASDNTNDDAKQASSAENKTTEKSGSKDGGQAGSASKDAAAAAGEFMPPKPSAEQEASSKEQMRFDGSWRGTTSQNKPISFKILNRFLGHIEVTYTLEGDGCKAEEKTAKASAMVGLRSAAFTLTNTSTTEKLTASGMFTADAESNGQFKVEPVGDVPAGCNASVEGTWKATK